MVLPPPEVAEAMRGADPISPATQPLAATIHQQAAAADLVTW